MSQKPTVYIINRNHPKPFLLSAELAAQQTIEHTGLDRSDTQVDRALGLRIAAAEIEMNPPVLLRDANMQSDSFVEIQLVHF